MLLFINHKANLTLEEIILYEKELRDLDVTIFPSLCYLSLFQNGKYKLGAQDVSEFDNKEKTGEINAKQLKSLNVKYCLIGHRDRRVFKKERIETLLRKVEKCIKSDITPIYFLNDGLINNKYEINKLYKTNNEKEIIFVYEPYKNIGQGNPDLSLVDSYIKNIKGYIRNKFSKNVKVLYGGGINLNNINFIKKLKNIDGIIVSTSTLNITDLKKLYDIVNE